MSTEYLKKPRPFDFNNLRSMDYADQNVIGREQARAALDHLQQTKDIPHFVSLATQMAECPDALSGIRVGFFTLVGIATL